MQYTILKGISSFLCMLPHGVLLWLGKVLGGVYYRLAKRQRELAIAQCMRSLQLEYAAAERLIKENFANIGRNFLEIMYMPNLTRENFLQYMELDHMERLQEAWRQGHGVVILTAHVGNWEWLSAAVTFSGVPLTAIIKPQPNEQHTRLLNEFREMVGVEVFSRGTTELVGAAKALKKGKTLGFLADQDAGVKGAFIDFLGRTASTPLGPAAFAKRFHSPVVPAFIIRKPDGKHKVLIKEPLHYKDTGDAEKDAHDLTVRMTRVVESVIKEYPSQWLWFQKRWNTAPELRWDKHHAEKVQVGHEK